MLHLDIRAYYPSNDAYYQYYDYKSASSVSNAVSQLEIYINEEGPFDGIIGYSQGASLAATYLLKCCQDHPSQPLPVKCAVFISGGCFDPQSLKSDDLQWIDAKEPLLNLPTAHIWGRNDTVWPGSAEGLYVACHEPLRQMYVHDEGHNIPGAGAKEAVQGSVRAIRRTIDQGLLAQ